MSTASCAFAVRHLRPGADDVLARRIAALERFYAPVGLQGSAGGEAAPGVSVGAIGEAADDDRLLCWGAPFGAVAPTGDEVLAASELRLRREMVGSGLAFAWDGRTTRVLTAPSGPVGGYHARSDQFEVWASHAVAAAWLASGDARVDPEAVAELLAYDFCGHGHSLVTGAQPIAHATRVELGPDGVVTDCWWPSRERWAPVAPEEAHEHIAGALRDTLLRRTGARAGLCLTAGADSRVLAIALRELGVEQSAITWGEPGWPEVEGSERVAAALEIPWRAVARWRDDDEIAARADAEARWSDGAFGIAPSSRVWPGEPAVLVGAAGEVGRAFYWRAQAGGPEPGNPSALTDALFPEGRLAGGRPETQAMIRERVGGWVDQALESGRRGWSALDVLYAEQRVGHWGRSQVPSLDSDFLAGFGPVEVMRGLSSLSHADRLGDGFHRAFVGARRPDLALAEPVPPPSPPGRVRRLAGRRRRRRPASTPAGNPFLLDLWARRPATRARVAEAVLADPLIAEPLGAGWCTATRDGFLAGDSRATELALMAGGPVGLAAALRELQLR
jgi:hypothetical protein